MKNNTADCTKYVPAVFLGLMLFHFASAYPGGMTSDSLDQFNQSISLNFQPHHPPLTTFVWSILHHIYIGPQTMLFLNIALFWSAITILFYSDSTNRFRKYYFIIPFAPNIMTNSGMIWKDVAFSFSTLLAFAICIYYNYKNQRAPFVVFIILLILCFYAIGAKFQAQFVIPIVLLFILRVCFKSNLIIRLIICSILSFALIYGNNVLVQKLCPGGVPSEDMRISFDLAGISVRIDDDSIMPEYIKKGKFYSFNKVKELYTPAIVDPLMFPKDPTIPRASNKEEMEAVKTAWRKALTSQPLAYLSHRAMNFYIILKKGNTGKTYAFISEENSEKIGLKFIDNPVKKFIVSYLKLFPFIFTTNFISFLLLILYTISSIRNRRDNSPGTLVLRYIVTFSIAYSLVLFFTTMSSDYRYYYVIRLLTLLSIPIYFNTLFFQKTL